MASGSPGERCSMIDPVSVLGGYPRRFFGSNSDDGLGDACDGGADRVCAVQFKRGVEHGAAPIEAKRGRIAPAPAEVIRGAAETQT